MDCYTKAGEFAEAKVHCQCYKERSFQTQVILREEYTRQLCHTVIALALGANLLSCSLSGSIVLRYLLVCSFWCLRALTTYTDMTIFTSLFFLNPSCILQLVFSSSVSVSQKTDQVQDETEKKK